ncbi:hypothetical protein G6F62_014031 [Rhizopus arrhizus]|nr:hypothetical protein G6F23_014596 [Rhizopus arrhizus]KAG0759025.1 hypothetical protein G6F22_019483 [Rhizopus arrhizus]KAG0774357.1 hypothetical protein G6F21_014173 [Rhizopus arrhizus]KAG0803231.1 hypothetical protein G6F20_013705 [Rhizopus arrhizus]KAG0807813.1 hypothetical protein G6F19_013786 [Rhizopus arrhizus]
MYSGYWWPGAYQDVKDYVASCTKCQVYARASTKAPLVGTVPITSLFERFAIDYVGPFPASKKGNKYIIVAMEYFTRWPIARAVKSTDSKTTIDFLYEEIFCNFGPPQYLLSDNGTHFVSAVKCFKYSKIGQRRINETEQ